jgi:predicted ArsR family transcriptional regulator
MANATLQQQARALGDPTRHAIFLHVAHARRPVGVADLNERFPVNHNAIRQHLAKLLDAGLVVENKEPRTGRGRPRLVYTVDPAVEGRWGTTGPYERLSRLLVEIIRTRGDPEEVGRRAANEFRDPTPSGDAVADLSAAMARQGFEPEVHTRAGATEIVLRNCPFAAAALVDRATVCALHLGIAKGLTAGTTGQVDELIAYNPHKAGCRIHIRDADDAAVPNFGGVLSLRK